MTDTMKNRGADRFVPPLTPDPDCENPDPDCEMCGGTGYQRICDPDQEIDVTGRCVCTMTADMEIKQLSAELYARLDTLADCCDMHPKCFVSVLEEAIENAKAWTDTPHLADVADTLADMFWQGYEWKNLNRKITTDEKYWKLRKERIENDRHKLHERQK